MSNHKIFIVDDEKDIVDLISYNLKKEGFYVIFTYDGSSVINLVKTQKPNLIILDLMLPVISGLEICSSIRKNPEIAQTPIIMLTAKSDQIDKIVGLEIGADDYITKPFHIRELIARIRAVLRRFEGDIKGLSEPNCFSFKGLSINFASYELDFEQILMECQKIIFFTPNIFDKS